MKLHFIDKNEKAAEAVIIDGVVTEATGILAVVRGWRKPLFDAFAAKHGLSLVRMEGDEKVRQKGECGSLEWTKGVKFGEAVTCFCGSQIMRRRKTDVLGAETQEQWVDRVRRWKLEHPGEFVAKTPTKVP